MCDKNGREAEFSASRKNNKSADGGVVEDRARVGYIDSVYCGSGVDGAGLRCVVFFAGCNLRCPFCHNPETLFQKGKAVSAEELVQKLRRYKPYFKRGGVTLSGGEPFLQKEFCLALARLLREENIRVAFETNGHVCDPALIAAGELICDVKNQETDDLSVYERFFAECVRQGKLPRVTNVLVPGKNDREEKLRTLARLVRRHFPQGNIRFLPFVKLCADKYAALGRFFPYADVRECEKEDVLRAERIVNEVFSQKI